MQPTMSLNVDEFQKTVKDYISNIEKSIPKALNDTMRDIVFDAVKGTPVADRAVIEAKLRQPVSVKTRRSKDGTLKTVTKYKPLPMAYALAINSRKKKGLPPYRKEELKAAATRMINGKLSAVGSLRSGWTGAVKAFSGADIVKADAKVKAKGFGYKATDGIKPTAKIIYNLNTRRSAGIDPRVVDSLDRAFKNAEAKMQRAITDSIRTSGQRAGVT